MRGFARPSLLLENPINVIGVSAAQTTTFSFLLTSHLRFMVEVTLRNKHSFGDMEVMGGMVQKLI